MGGVGWWGWGVLDQKGAAIAAAQQSQVFSLTTRTRAPAQGFLWSPARGNRTRLFVFGPFSRVPRQAEFLLFFFSAGHFNGRKCQSGAELTWNQPEVRVKGPGDPLVLFSIRLHGSSRTQKYLGERQLCRRHACWVNYRASWLINSRRLGFAPEARLVPISRLQCEEGVTLLNTWCLVHVEMTKPLSILSERPQLAW